IQHRKNTRRYQILRVLSEKSNLTVSEISFQAGIPLDAKFFSDVEVMKRNGWIDTSCASNMKALPEMYKLTVEGRYYFKYGPPRQSFVLKDL
ncbi:MAG: hypothetical protein AAGM67_17790, partial [Bacteroidota bacterium]